MPCNTMPLRLSKAQLEIDAFNTHTINSEGVQFILVNLKSECCSSLARVRLKRSCCEKGYKCQRDVRNVAQLAVRSIKVDGLLSRIIRAHCSDIERNRVLMFWGSSGLQRCPYKLQTRELSESSVLSVRTQAM